MSQQAILEALTAARDAMTNQRYMKPCIDMEEAWAKVDAAICAMTPSPLANVLYDLIDDCFEKGRTPTLEEIEPFLRPKVKALVWRWVQYRAAWIATVGEDSDHEYWVQGEDGRFRWTCMTLGAGNAHGHCPTLELAQAAAQDHWERRANEFFKEAFE